MCILRVTRVADELDPPPESSAACLPHHIRTDVRCRSDGLQKPKLVNSTDQSTAYIVRRVEIIKTRWCGNRGNFDAPALLSCSGDVKPKSSDPSGARRNSIALDFYRYEASNQNRSNYKKILPGRGSTDSQEMKARFVQSVPRTEPNVKRYTLFA